MINRERDIASGPLRDHLLVKPDEHLEVLLCHDLDCANNYEHVENHVAIKYTVRGIGSGPLRDTRCPNKIEILKFNLFIQRSVQSS